MSETMDLAALRRLCEAAPAGPWKDGPPAWFRHRTNPEEGKRAIYSALNQVVGNVYGKDTAAFIAAARTALPTLLDRLAMAEGALEAVCHTEVEKAGDYRKLIVGPETWATISTTLAALRSPLP